METKQIVDCKLIDAPKITGGVRSFNKEFAIQLATSIHGEGQLSPVILRPNPAKPGRYLMVSGRHRLYAIKNVLKGATIEAVVYEDMKEEEAEIAMNAENLFRQELSKAQHASAFKRWHDYWLERLPAPSRTNKSSTPDPAPAPAPVAEPVEKTEEVEDFLSYLNEGTEATQPAPEPKAESFGHNGQFGAITKEGEFDQKVAGITGQSERAVRRIKAVAKAFDHDQLEVFDQLGLSQNDMLTIAKIKDKASRDQVVSLVASGRGVTDAMKDVLKEAAPAPVDAQSEEAKEVTKEKKKARIEKAPEMTDEEWFEHNCGESAKLFSNPAKFKADAILYRHTADARAAFRASTKKLLKLAKDGGVYGGLYNLINRATSLAHPKDWLICSECKGRGEFASADPSRPEPTKCRKCFGSCYNLKTEDYL